MDVSLSQLLEESVDIAWVYLDRLGELNSGNGARFLTDAIEHMIRRGHRNRMFLGNMAIIQVSGHEKQRSNVIPIREDA